jgi:hypothetical protein
MVSKTSTGPVLPKMVSGWPANKAYVTPTTAPETKDSIAAMLLPVASPSNPPNVMIGVRQAKYRKIQEAMHWSDSASVKSDTYLLKC